MQIVVLKGALNRPTHERKEHAGGRSFPDLPAIEFALHCEESEVMIQQATCLLSSRVGSEETKGEKKCRKKKNK